jgi:hypothetical protein
LVFEKKEVLEDWVSTFVTKKPENYVVIYTREENEVIVHPVVTSRPIFVGYFKGAENLEKFAKEISEKYKIPFLEVLRVEWDIEKQVGIKYRTLEE